ncbi:hypothetical protein [Actinomycetospora succinea]|uniref:hypothetical protein n=1 Tax=Actinomycetospora succinea TaxID=663603 RepID=UPI00105DCB24|nr:hypothetical protein [Actinomycetospora succinea]
MGAQETEVDALFAALRRHGLAVDTRTASPTVAPRGNGGPAAVLDLAEDLLGAYLDDVAAGYAPFEDDPRAVARGLVAVQLAEHLTADHGDGVNRVRRVSLVLDEGAPRLVEERNDDGDAPPSADGPHDDPAVFAAELEALARHLREQGFDTEAVPGRATIRIDGRTVELPPDLYRVYLEAQEEEFEALGGDPRSHAWAAWCRLVAGLLRDGAPGLSLATAPDGEVRLVPHPTSDADPDPPLEWSAEPGH